MPRLYRYVGPKPIADRAAASPPGTVVESAGDIRRWVEQSGQAADRGGRITATFVVGPAGKLRLADRRSEHVACAGGGPVLAAGEITLEIGGDAVGVEEVTNQSTGYCPEPESWPAVAAALKAAGLSVPEGYTVALVFRRCPRCGQIHVVKDRVFECSVCGAALPARWNLADATDA